MATVELTPQQIRSLIFALEARAVIIKSKMVQAGAGTEGWRFLRHYIRQDEGLAAYLSQALKTGEP